MTDVFPQPSEHHPSGPVGEDWLRRQRRMASARQELAVDRGTLTLGLGPRGYRVKVEGRGLYLALSPPDVTVGGVAVTDLVATRDGTSLTGRVVASPPNSEFVIDYGFARAEVTLIRKTRWWNWLRPSLLRSWAAIDRVVRRGLEPPS